MRILEEEYKVEEAIAVADNLVEYLIHWDEVETLFVLLILPLLLDL